MPFGMRLSCCARRWWAAWQTNGRGWGRQYRVCWYAGWGADLLLAPEDLPTFTKLHPGRVRQRQALPLGCPFSEACPPPPFPA